MSRHSKQLRELVVARDGWFCWICGNPIASTLGENHPGAASLDHVIPRAAGGSDELINLRLAHRRCNEVRGTSLRQLSIADRLSLRDRGTVARA